MRMTVFRLCGQRSGVPSGVAAQSAHKNAHFTATIQEFCCPV
jgi:hypothetical protein